MAEWSSPPRTFRATIKMAFLAAGPMVADIGGQAIDVAGNVLTNKEFGQMASSLGNTAGTTISSLGNTVGNVYSTVGTSALSTAKVLIIAGAVIACGIILLIFYTIWTWTKSGYTPPNTVYRNGHYVMTKGETAYLTTDNHTVDRPWNYTRFEQRM